MSSRSSKLSLPDSTADAPAAIAAATAGPSATPAATRTFLPCSHNTWTSAPASGHGRGVLSATDESGALRARSRNTSPLGNAAAAATVARTSPTGSS